MAELTDEEKAKLVLGDVEEETPAETPEEPEAPSEPEDEPAGEVEAEPPKEEEAQPEPTTFTKQFQNLKGDSWDTYGPELETAYVNSTNEALRLKKQLDDNVPLIEEAKRIVAEKQAAQPQENPASPNLLTIDSHPDVQYAKQLREREMITAFNDFAKEFPQARETDEFNKFTAASNGVALAFAAGNNGTQPSYPELFNGIASVLGWTSTTKEAKKDAAIKDLASTSQVNSSGVSPARRTKVTDAEVDVYLKMFTSKTREEAIKELGEVKG